MQKEASSHTNIEFLTLLTINCQIKRGGEGGPYPFASTDNSRGGIRHCKGCSETGHNKRTCKKGAAEIED